MVGRGEGGGLAVSWMPAYKRTMVGAVAHECSPACSISCNNFTLRTGRIEHSSSGRSWLGGHMPLLTSGGGLATGTDVSRPEGQMEKAHARRPNFGGMRFAVGI